jgi:hypothetical protein
MGGMTSPVLQKAYPEYDKTAYHTYKQDSIIGTWEKLADIVLLKDSDKSFICLSFICFKKKIEGLSMIRDRTDRRYSES